MFQIDRWREEGMGMMIILKPLEVPALLTYFFAHDKDSVINNFAAG